jgi:hypothetical protein
MAITRRAGSLSLAQQALALRRAFPQVKVLMRGTVLTWTGPISPTPLSRCYTVRVTYRAGEHPRVAVIDPPLQPDENGHLPHFYRDGSICLYAAGEWDASMFIADTILPWTAEWLAHYELWKRSGRWHGDDPVGQQDATAAPGEVAPANRAGRRRAAAAEARRARREQGPDWQPSRSMTSAWSVIAGPVTGPNGDGVPNPASSTSR